MAPRTSRKNMYVEKMEQASLLPIPSTLCYGKALVFFWGNAVVEFIRCVFSRLRPAVFQGTMRPCATGVPVPRRGPATRNACCRQMPNSAGVPKLEIFVGVRKSEPPIILVQGSFLRDNCVKSHGFYIHT